MSRERDIDDIEAALSAIDPQATVEAEPGAEGGTRITVEVDGVTHRFSIGKGRSALLNFLLTGHVD